MRLTEEFATLLPAANLQDLQDYKVFVRTLAPIRPNGPSAPAGPFSVKTYPPLPRERHAAERNRVLRTTRQRFTKPRTSVDATLASFLLGKPDARHADGKAGGTQPGNPRARRHRLQG